MEFSIIALPFLTLLGGILQTAIMIWAQQNLDYGLQRAVRSLFTGQFQIQNTGQTNAATLLAALRSNMCGSGTTSIATVFDCTGVKVDVTLGTSFASSQVTSPVDPATRDWATGFGTHYTCAAPGSIVIVTAAAKFPNFFGLLNASLASFADGSALLQSTAVFRTEPYQTSGVSSC